MDKDRRTMLLYTNQRLDQSNKMDHNNLTGVSFKFKHMHTPMNVLYGIIMLSLLLPSWFTLLCKE